MKIKIELSLLGLPMPPTSNTQYVWFQRGGKIRTASSGELKSYKKSMDDYFLLNYKDLNYQRDLFLQNWDKHKLLTLNAGFYFDRKDIYTKQGKPKKLDLSNRIKALHDTVMTWIGIDDSYIFNMACEKLVAVEEMGNFVNVSISFYEEE